MKRSLLGLTGLIQACWLILCSGGATAQPAPQLELPRVTLSAGMVPGQQCVTNPVVRIGDRCLIGKGSGIVGHLAIDIGNDVWTGHHVYITDQNHGFEDVAVPISRQSMPERPVTIGDGSWLGFGTVVLPGAEIGQHVVVGANSVVTGALPDFCVAVGAPARVMRSSPGSRASIHTRSPSPTLMKLLPPLLRETRASTVAKKP